MKELEEDFIAQEFGATRSHDRILHVIYHNITHQSDRVRARGFQTNVQAVDVHLRTCLPRALGGLFDKVIDVPVRLIVMSVDSRLDWVMD